MQRQTEIFTEAFSYAFKKVQEMIDDKMQVESFRSVTFKNWKCMHLFNREEQEKSEISTDCFYRDHKKTNNV